MNHVGAEHAVEVLLVDADLGVQHPGGVGRKAVLDLRALECLVCHDIPHLLSVLGALPTSLRNQLSIILIQIIRLTAIRRRSVLSLGIR